MTENGQGETMPDNQGSGDYGADKIQVLEGMAAVRKRPGMYIGDPGGNGLYQLVWETIDNSIDEALAGHCTDISVTVHADGSLSVQDNGRGIPVAEHPTEKKSTLEVVMTVLHAGGKFDRNSYKVSGGLHGVGVSCVNAVSSWLVADVKREGTHWRMRFERGAAVTALEQVGPAKERGTAIHFQPDPEVFGANLVFDYKIIASRLRELAFLNSGIRISFQDLREEGKAEVFFSKEGLAGFVKYLNGGKEALHPVIHFQKDDPETGVSVELALQYNDSYDEQVLCFANNIRNRDGGAHLEGFKTALTRELNTYAKNSGLLKGDKPPAGDDLREGLCAIISVKLPEPKFSNQTKDKLINGEIAGTVQTLAGGALKDYCEESPKVAKLIIGKAMLAMQAREAARKARELVRKDRKSLLNGAGMPDKLRDCSSRNVDETEVFLVEGDSAGGSAKRGSDARFQAILPLKGKIINVEKARIDKVIGHSEISAMIQAFGCGIGEDFHLDGLRYGKIIIMTDADVDGSHIRTLLLTFFFRQLPQLIASGRIFVACPPLYKVRRGKRFEYVFNEKVLQAEITRMGLDECVLVDRHAGAEREVRGEPLEQLCDLLAEIEEHERVLALKGLTLDEYLSLRNAKGLLPLYHVRIGDSSRYLADEEAMADLLASIKSDAVEGEAIPPEIIEFTEREPIEATLATLAGLGFAADFLHDGPNRVDPFTLRWGKGEQIFTSLRQLLVLVKRVGQEGLDDIQRYKGLGEMNPDELAETTMHPSQRILKQVNMTDAIEAERMFSTLMGNDVAIRRDFIERYALAVAKKLDV